MKRTLIILGVIILAVFIALSVMDKSDYKIEKKLWRIQKRFNKIARDPVSAPSQEYDAVEKLYAAVIDDHPETTLLPNIYLQISRLYGMKKEYNKARLVLEECMLRFSDNQKFMPEAIINVAMLYEAEGNEKGVLETFERVKKEYPLTEIGLTTPLNIVNYYTRANKGREASDALIEAVAYYKKIARDNRNTKVEFDALRLLVTTYYMDAKWQEAMSTLERILFGFADDKLLKVQRVNLIIKTINTVAVQKLGSFDVAIGLYQRFIDNNPRHGLSTYLKGIIKAWLRFGIDMMKP